MADYIWDALHGDFGESWRTREPVFEEIFARIPTTIYLAAGAMLLAVLLGVPLGILSAVKQYSFLDVLNSVVAMFLSAIPAFWLGLLSILLFALKLRLLPSDGADTASAFILPIVTLALPGAAELLRLTRSTMLEIIRQDYIRTARAKGASERIVIWRHALRNATLPIITVAGMYFGSLLGGSVITESVFSMPGVGSPDDYGDSLQGYPPGDGVRAADGGAVLPDYAVGGSAVCILGPADSGTLYQVKGGILS